ncbi:MAG: L-threonylcarbamoyladenylate synthase [Candidatus Pacebacteria bacterium]|nr:L-threonylcarbamoyladenylate synthase [Candidatus Paceibacterota bacterium]
MARISSEAVRILINGGVGVLSTDTLYGLVGSAFEKKAVERIYELKKRSPRKPFIILISGTEELERFGVALDDRLRDILGKLWPGPVSVILDCPSLASSLSYLKPFEGTLAFRCPKPKWLNVLLREAGPLVAPSANPEGLAPAQTIAQAKAYFKDEVDFYCDAGALKGEPSTLLGIKDGDLTVLRQGKTKV